MVTMQFTDVRLMRANVFAGESYFPVSQLTTAEISSILGNMQ